MSGAFWSSWQLWEKLCFILGMGIVFVIIAGIIKLIYNRYRIRKYSELAATQNTLRQTLGQTAIGKRGRGADVPFGIRAIESGIEVEGVWISGSNTPATTRPGTPALSPATERPRSSPRDPSPSDHPTHLEIPQASTPSSRPSTARLSYQPRRSSGLRYSDSHELSDGDETVSGADWLTTLESGQQSGGRPSGVTVDESRRSSSWSTTSYIQSYEEDRHNLQGDTPTNGFLHPRYQYVDRRNLQSQPDDTPKQADQLHNNDHDSPPSSEVSDPFLTPTQSNHTTQPSHSSSQETIKITPPTSTIETSVTSPDISDVLGGSATPESRRTSQINVRDSHVLRKINSGFEILRPGTFDRPQSADIEMVAGLHERTERNEGESGKGRQSRKLQKRRGRDSLVPAK